MSQPTSPDDGERDAWLREALRHAPDAALAAPAQLREAILSQARAAAAVPSWPNAPRHAEPVAPWAALWSWLARPPVAAGFASVMAATLVGLMWWDRPMDEALPQTPAATVAGNPAPAQPPTVSEAPAATPATTATTGSPAAAASPPPRVVAATAVPARPVAPAEAARRQAVAAAPAEAKEEQRAAGRAADANVAESTLADGAAKKQLQAPPPRAFGSTDKLAASSEKDRAAPQAERERERDAAVAKNDSPASPAGAMAAAPATTMAKAARPLPAAPAAAPAPPALTAPQAFADARGAAPAEDARSRWLAEVDAAAAGRWERLDGTALRRDETAVLAAANRPGAVRVPAAGGRPAGILRIDGTRLRFESSGETPPQIWQAELPAAVAERLRATLPRQPP